MPCARDVGHVVAALALAVAVLGCKRSPSVSGAFVVEADRVRTMTAPEGARIEGSGDAVLEATRVRQQWRVAFDGPWSRYAETVQQALAPYYRCASGKDSLRCLRSIAGDAFQLELTSEAGGDGSRARVRFEARPD